MSPRLPDGPFVVAIDGPAGSGKSTLARKVAEAIDGVVIDTGAMYRAVTAALLDQGFDPADPHAAATVAEGLLLRFEPGEEGQRLMVNGEDWSKRIRLPRVAAAVSTVAAHPAVRARMVALQRDMGREGRVVMEGRDIGSNV
ncbi:MAG: (d)CMP kinase, partial [Nitrospinae bacterium]|nr:(d)CMP kinase [Nitrospinota bacterium]